MSDETRSTHAKVSSRKSRPKILVVNNPSPDSSSDDQHEASSSYPSYPYHPRPLPSPVHSIPYEQPQLSHAPHIPAPLTTNLPDHRHHYPSSRSNPSNPALSSPSSTSSRAFESTPPPSTPGQSAPPVDLSGEGTLRQEHIYPTPNDRIEGAHQPSSRSARLFDQFMSHLSRPGHTRRGSNNRPATSPTVLTPDSSQPANGFRSSPSEKVTLLVTADADNFSIVDITGAMTPAFIRERIFTKLQIPDEDQPRFSIYRTEIGRYAIGDALTDEQLFDLYRDRGDAKGTVKLFVSHSSAPVHESLDDSALVSPTISTIPPPVLPQHSLSPLQPLRRTRSRQDSQSSASEHQQPEATTGYEASVSDDLEPGERETRRSTIRPPPQQRALPSQYAHSPVNSYRAQSPVGDMPSDRPRMQSLESSSGRPETYRGSTLPVLPTAHCTSPQNPRFREDTHASPPSMSDAHAGSTSDVVERERHIQTSDAQASQQDWQRRAFQERERFERLRRKDSSGRSKDINSRRPKPPSHDSTETKRSQESWTVIPSDVPTSNYKKDRPTTPQETRSPSKRFQGGGFGPLSLPRTPPNSSSGSGEPRTHGKSRGKAVPQGWAVRWTGPAPAVPSKTEQRPMPPPQLAPSPFQQSRMTAKSMTDMRGAYKSQHPASLQPGRSSRPQPHLPLLSRPNTGGSSTTSGNMLGASSGDGLPASYHETSHMEVVQRAYEAQRKTLSPTAHHSPRTNGSPAYSPAVSVSSPSYLGAASPANDPYPRPPSSVDDSAISLPCPPSRSVLLPRPSDDSHNTTGLRSSSFPSNYPAANGTNTSMTPIHDDAGANGSISTPASLHSPLPQVDGLPVCSDVPYSNHSHRSPPRSPVGVSSNNRSREDVDYKPPEVLGPRPSSAHTGSSQRGIIDEDNQDDTIVGRDAQAWLIGFIDENTSEDGTTKPRPRMPPTTSNVDLPPRALETMSNSTFVNDDDSDSDGGTHSIWAKPPKSSDNSSKMSSARPHLPPLSIENSPSSRPAPLPNVPHTDLSRVPPANFPAPPDYIPQAPAPRTPRRNPPGAKSIQDQRTSKFDSDYDYTWAPRPPPEDVYERLEEYFPQHDLDKPVIETPSGGTSPTTEQTISPPQRYKHKKSIRVVAAEHKRRIDRSSRMETSSSSATAVLRKRGTKLWGSKLEEVTTEQAKTGLPSSASSDSSPGTVAKPIFRWVRGELIGKGTYGKVYLALNATTGEMIAVKQVEMPRTASDKDDSRQVSVVEALKLESETLKDLDHPNIVQYLGFEETPTFLSIFLEYVPGGSIASCLRKHGKFDEEVTKSFTGQILSGLEYLHSKGILHRDLKADNILVETTGTCKISDFGISRRTDDINMAGAYTSMQGTVFWMAPEVIDSGKSGYNSKIDIWSVGCVVFEMWTGQRPWSGQEAMAVLLQLYKTKQGPPVPSNVSLTPLADDFRQRCFAMDPDERPTAAELRKHSYLELRPGWTFNGFK